MMYNPPKFLTPEVLAEVLAEFSWPGPYTVEDDRPDGIEVRLPKCSFYVSEGFESDMDLTFLPESTGLKEAVPLADALSALRKDSSRTLPPHPTLIDYFSPGASLDKVKNELRDLFMLLFTYFPSSLEGHFDWASEFQRPAQ
jgi:hypothetical protein